MQLEQSFTAWLYRPYVDLGPAASGAPFHVIALEFGSNALFEDRSYPRLQAALNASFRDALIFATDLHEHRVSSPLGLPRALRTPRWQGVCDMAENFSTLPPRSQVRLAWLLGKLCFHRFLLEVVPEDAGDRIAKSNESASLAYLRALARYRLSLDDQDEGFLLDEFERIALEAPPGIARVDAHYQMVAQNVKHKNDLEAVAYWQPLHLQAIESSRPEFDEFTYLLVMSRYHRVGGFLPQMRRDKNGVLQEMDLAERFARALPRNDEFQRIAADEMLYPVLESRTKEAIWMGDMDLAAERARRLIELSPQDPRAFLHYGEVLLEQGDVEGALRAYRNSALFSPPGREIACFMAAQCYEELGDLESARDAYIAALRADPLGVSTAERLEAVAERLNCQPLLHWVRELLTGLRERQQHARPPRGEPYKNMPAPVDPPLAQVVSQS